MTTSVPTTTQTKMTAVFKSNDSSNKLCFVDNDGSGWGNTGTTGQATKYTPSAAAFQLATWVAYVANNASSTLYVCYSPFSRSGQRQWSGSISTGQASSSGPSLAVFNNKLFVAFNSSVGASDVLVCSSADGTNWSPNVVAAPKGLYRPALAVFQDKLWLAYLYQANNGGTGALVIYSSTDGVSWTKANQPANLAVSGGSWESPSLTVYNGTLYMALCGGSGASLSNGNQNVYSKVMVSSSANGANWSVPVDTGQTSSEAPTIGVLDNKLYVSYVAANASNTLLCTTSSNGTSWSGANGMAGNTSPNPPGLATLTATSGAVFPSYHLLSIVYAPPGTSGGYGFFSTVNYGSSSTTGTAASTSKSFSTGKSVDIDASAVGFSQGLSFDYTKTNTTESTTTVNKSSSFSIQVQGPPTDGINHDFDQYWLWLNPQLNVNIDTAGNIQWALAVDGVSMKIQYVTAGQLRGTQTIPPVLKKILNDAGLTSDRYASLLQTNPFSAVGTGAVDPLTIDSKRYVALPQSFPYQPPVVADGTVSLSQYGCQSSIEQTTTQTASVEYSCGYTSGVGIEGLFSASLSTSGKFTWTSQTSTSNTFGTSEAASLTIGGPAFGWPGGEQLQVYWDRIYKSFLFVLLPAS